LSEQLIISISGLRGIIGRNLTASIAADYGCAFGTFLKSGRTGAEDGRLSVCIGRDSRRSGQMLTSAVAAGLCSVGVDVVDLGIVPTPTVGVMLTHLGSSGGVVITASHNPIEYNGIKLLLGNGMAPPADAAGRIKQCFLERGFDLADSSGCGGTALDETADGTHIDKVLAIVDRDAVAAKGFKVVLDSVNGAGGRVAAINDEPTGIFAHTPEPVAENLTGLCEAVKSQEAEIGFAQDPDADRLAIVDEMGTYIGEEYTLAMAAKQVLSRETGSVATNLSTSRMIDDVAGKAGCRVIRTPVGEAHVASAMLEHHCVIGGEGNGGIIDLRVGPIRDSLVGQLMAETGRTVSELAAQIGGYYMTKQKFAADHSHVQEILALAKETFADARVDSSDGCRFDFEDGWLHLRSSNTEPVMRAIVEAKDRSIAQRYLDAFTKIRAEILG